MEIESWPSVLKAKEQRYELNGLKWWFHLYTIVNEQDGGEDEEEDKKILDQTLQEYVFITFSELDYLHFLPLAWRSSSNPLTSENSPLVSISWLHLRTKFEHNCVPMPKLLSMFNAFRQNQFH